MVVACLIESVFYRIDTGDAITFFITKVWSVLKSLNVQKCLEQSGKLKAIFREFSYRIS